MPTARWGAASAVASGKLYVLGGDGGGLRCLDEVERFCPTCGAWERVLPMGSSRCSGHMAFHLGGALFRARGRGSRNSLGTSFAESRPSPLPYRSPRDTSVAVAHAGGIYIFGGCDSRQVLRSAERLDVTAGHWEAGMIITGLAF